MVLDEDSIHKHLADARWRKPAMKQTSPTRRSPGTGSGTRASRAVERSRVARVGAELEMTPAERLTLALELSDLCEELAEAGRSALKERW